MSARQATFPKPVEKGVCVIVYTPRTGEGDGEPEYSPAEIACHYWDMVACQRIRQWILVHSRFSCNPHGLTRSTPLEYVGGSWSVRLGFLLTQVLINFSSQLGPF